MRVFWAILWKDLQHEWRSRELVLVMALFSLLVIILFSFALGVHPDDPEAVASALMWIAFSFAGILGLNRSLALERENRSLQALLLSPVDRSWIYLAKAVGNLTFILVVELAVFPLTLLAFNVEFPVHWGITSVVLFLGAAGFTAVGTLLAGIASGTRVRDWLLPLLLFPVEVPVLISSVKATWILLSGRPVDEVWIWVQILVVFDVIFLVISLLAFEHVVEE